MPAPGEEDMGGNPLKEGILADGGWQNRMKRDESFASVRTAGDEEWDDEVTGPIKTHSFIVTPKGQVHSSPFPATHEDIAQEAGLDFENAVHTPHPHGLSLGYLNDDGSATMVQNSSPYLAQELPGLLERHFGHPVSVDPNLQPSTNEDRWNQGPHRDPNDPATLNDNFAVPGSEHGDWWEEQKRKERDAVKERGRPFPYYDNPYINRGGSFIEDRLHPHASWLISSDEDLAKEAAFLAPLAVPVAEGLAGGAAAAEVGGAAAGAAGLGAGEGVGLLGNPIVQRIGISGLMHGVMGGGGGGSGSGQPQQQVAPAMPDEYLSHTAGPLDHPSSLPELGAQEGDDPEAVDQHEVNDGDHANPYDPSVNDQGGTDTPGDLQISPETTHKIEMLLPLLVEYFNSPQSGADDPLVKALHEAIEAEHPGYLDNVKTSAGPIMAPMVGQPGTGVTPAPQPQSTPPSPNGVGNCAYCGAQLPPGSTVCPQCNAATAGGGVLPQPGSPQANPQLTAPTQQGPPNYYGHTVSDGYECPCGMTIGRGEVCMNCHQWTAPYTPDPNEDALLQAEEDRARGMARGAGMVDPNAGAAMMPPGAGDPSMMAPPPMAPPPAAPGSQGSQGPQTKEQFAAVAQALVEQNRADEIPNMLQNPDQYAKELAEVQQKQPVPQDIAGEQADPTAQQMQAPQAPMEPPVARVAADSVAPKCPECGSHTTGVMSEEGHCGCHACGHSWKEPFVKAASPHVHEQLHQHVDALGLPAADQVAQENVENEQDSSHLWQTDEGAPLKVGSEYEMYSSNYDIPDIIRIEAVKPDAIDYTIAGEYGLHHSTEVTAEEAQTMGYSFKPIGPGDEEQDQTAADAQQFEGPTQGVTDLSVPPRSSSRDWLKEGTELNYLETDIPPDMTLPEYRACRACREGVAKDDGLCERCAAAFLQNRDIAPEVNNVHPISKQAGKKYTPMEQREFIDEQGEARNSEKLDLKGTHYEANNLSPDYFLFGL